MLGLLRVSGAVSIQRVDLNGAADLAATRAGSETNVQAGRPPALETPAASGVAP
jgi:hypothetical protein